MEDEENSKLAKVENITIQTLTLILVILIILVLFPTVYTVKYKFNLSNGAYVASGKLGLNCELIFPESYGTTCFKIENTTQVDLICTMSITQVFNNEAVSNFPMIYQVKTHTKSSEWLSAEELLFENLEIKSGESRWIYINWWWPGEIDNDRDNYFGEQGGVFWLVFAITQS